MVISTLSATLSKIKPLVTIELETTLTAQRTVIDPTCLAEQHPI
jgi:hypothetical protein